jgi:hypothetical protein
MNGHRVVVALCPLSDIGRAAARSETQWFDSVFPAWDFVRKNQAESKFNLGEGAQGRNRTIQSIQCFAFPNLHQTLYYFL